MRVRDRHAEYYLNLAVATAPALTGPQQGRYLRQLDSEWDNVRAAFAHLRADERSDDVLRLGVAVARFVLSRGHIEVISYLGEALERADAEAASASSAHQVLSHADTAPADTVPADTVPAGCSPART